MIFEPTDMRYVLEYYAPDLPNEAMRDFDVEQSRESPLFVLASFQDNQAFFDRTNKVVGAERNFFRRQAEAGVRDVAGPGLGVRSAQQPAPTEP